MLEREIAVAHRIVHLEELRPEPQARARDVVRIARQRRAKISRHVRIAGTALLVAFIYYWLQEGAFGATMGKAIIGLRVTRPDGSVPGLGSSAIRNAFRLVDGLPLYMPGFFVAAFTRGRRRLGDFAAKTFVLEHAVPIGERVAVVFLWLAGISAAVWGAWMMCPTWFQLPLR